MMNRLLYAGLLWPVMVSACFLPRAETDPAVPVDLPEAFRTQLNGEGEQTRDPWWKAFADPHLDDLMNQALKANLDLRASWARLRQAEALADQADAPLMPQVGAEFQAERAKRLFNPQFGSFDFEQYAVSARVSYELDVWGKLTAQAKAAHLEWLAGRDDLEGLAMTITAQVAETWFDVVAARRELELVESQLKASDEFLELIRIRYARGLASAVDIHQQRQQKASVAALIPQAKARLEVAQNQLALLLGRPAQAAGATDQVALPSVPSLPGIGVPAQLLEQRPDIRAAQRRLVASDHRVTVALADLFPSLKLSGSVGYNAFDLSALFDDLVWSVVGSITQPIFEGGRRKAALDQADAAMDEQVARYGKTILTALTEVENALAQEKNQALVLEAVETQAEAAESALREARARYVSGLSDYLVVLNALQSAQNARRQLVGAKRQMLSFRIQLCRALGGPWTQKLEAPPAKEEEHDA